MVTSKLALVAAFSVVGACSTSPPTTSASQATAPFNQSALPSTVQVPAGHAVAAEVRTTDGKITYECREKKDATAAHEWVFVGPTANLVDRQGRQAGRYFGPPATWVAADGSTITGAQLAVAPASPGAIALQLVKANPATAPGSLAGVSHIQRVATVGGVAPAEPCNASALGARRVVNYQADYIYWKPR
jgi:hypothetical protein